MLKVTQLFGFGGGSLTSRSLATVTYLGSSSQTSDGTTQTLTSGAPALGTAVTGRQIIAGVIGPMVGANGIVSSMSLNSVSGTSILASSSGSVPCAFFYWNNATDTTVSALSAAFSQSASRSAAFLWSVVPVTPVTATEKANVAANAAATSVSDTWSATISDGGFLLAITYAGNTNALTWSGTSTPTEVDEISVESNLFGAAQNVDTLNALTGITVTGSGTTTRQLLGVAFDP